MCLFFLPMSAKIGIFAAVLWIFLADRTMEYISVKQFAEKFNVSERTARNYCVSGKIDGAYLVGKSWNIPALTKHTPGAKGRKD